MREKRLLLLTGNFYPEPTGIGKYTGEMIDWLANSGYSCTVVTTYPYYPFWKVQDNYADRRFQFRKERIGLNGTAYEVIRCPHYVPGNPTGFKRIISDFSFFVSCFAAALKYFFKKRYPYILVVAPPFQLGILGVFYKWTKGAKFLYHIQDLQIDAARDLKLIRSKLVINLLFRVEKFILNQADVITGISPGMIQKISEKCKKEVFSFPNWVDTQVFYPLPEQNFLKKEFGFMPSDKIVLYSGAIGEKQGLETVIDAADILKHSTHIKFIICGSGPYQKRLVDLARRRGLSNVFFLPVQPVEILNRFLNMADVHLVIQKSTASDLVMPSKLTTILAVGGFAIVTAPKGSSLYQVVSENKVGLVVEPENTMYLVEAIEIATNGNMQTVRDNARNYAEKHLSIDRILQMYTSHLDTSATLSSSSLEVP